MNWIEIIGWIGGIALSICAIPQVVKVHKTKDASGLSVGFLALWMKGEILTLWYIISNDIGSGEYQIPLYVNYGLNLVIVGYLIWAKRKYP